MQRVYKRLPYENLVKGVSNRSGYPIEVCEVVMKAMIDAIFDGVKMRKRVEVKHFGVFYLKFLNRRRIPQHYISGEEALAPAHVKICFKEEKFLRMWLADVYNEEIRKMNEQKDKEEAEEQ